MSESTLSENRFGRLTLVGNFPFFIKRRSNKWLCQCDCGKKTIVSIFKLRSGHTKSCGCLLRETRVSVNTHHGHGAKGKESGVYISWMHAKARCFNPSHKNYEDYGRRGITMCKRWRDSFQEFFNDLGNRPLGLTLDRINNNASYSCGSCSECQLNNWPPNCKWSSRLEQSRNQRRNAHKTWGKQ